jgi:hypothetical protein
MGRTWHVTGRERVGKKDKCIPLLIKIVLCFRLYVFGCITSFITISYRHTLSDTF